VRGPLRPPKDDAPLIVDANAVKASQLAAQGFEPISGWRPQIEKTVSAVQQVELPNRSCDDRGRERPHPTGANAVVEIRGRPVSERCDHAPRLSFTRYPCNIA